MLDFFRKGFGDNGIFPAQLSMKPKDQAAAPMKIDELKGKRIVFYVSKTSCPPCVQRMTPMLKELYPELQQKDVEIIYVAAADNRSKSWSSLTGDNEKTCRKYAMKMPFKVTFKGDKFLSMLKGDKELLAAQNGKPIYVYPSLYEAVGMNGKWARFKKVDLEDLGISAERLT